MFSSFSPVFPSQIMHLIKSIIKQQSSVRRYNSNRQKLNPYNIIAAGTLTVMSTQVVNLLNSTLNPSLLQSSQREIQRTRTNQGFATDLMIIADNNNNDIKIRQSALIVLKNMVYDQCANGNGINKADYEIVKGSILDALARQWGNKYLTPTLREIIHIIAQIDFPDRWPQILPAILNNITASSDFNSVAASVQALKAIASVCGRSVEQQITLNNLTNKIVVPLFELANKLFSNYTPQTQSILVSIFKIFNLVMFYHLPSIFINNIHSLMVFCKKIIDLQIEEMTPLKVACLKILCRLYSRHTTSSIPYKHLKFTQEFHSKYTVSLTQSFIAQLMNANSNPEVVNSSLICLTCIYKYSDQAASLIDKYHQQIIQFCLNRYKIGQLRSGQSVGSFITYMKEERSALIDFIIAMFNGNDRILGGLIQFLKKGDQKTQQLVLYIFGGLKEEIEDCPQLHQSMSQFIICFILPILSGQSSTIMKARGCQIISCYKYIELPAQNLQQIFQFVYSCLTENKDSYLNIYALQAFTQLICKYDSFMELIVPYLQDILNVYTNLMKESNGEVSEVISSFELFLKHLNGLHIKDCAVDLVKFLTSLFYEYHEQKDTSVSQSNENDELLQEPDEDKNAGEGKAGCLACIRQILAIDNLPLQLYPTIISDCILPLSATILSDKMLLHLQQGLNILNLCLYKSQKLPNNFEQFFKILTYALIGIPSELGSVNLPSQYKQILTIVCVEPDQDLVENVVGFFRNFIAKTKGQLRNIKDELGISFMEYIFRIVEHVQVSTTNNKPTYKKSDKDNILTLYTSLLQYQFLQPQQFELIVSNLLTWTSLSTGTQHENNVYIEIILMCVYYNIQLTLNKVNVEWLVTEILQRLALFKCEYQLSRLVLGVGRMLEKQVLKNEETATNLVKSLPNIVYRLLQQRVKEENQSNPQQKQLQEQIDLEEEAEEDLIGENTHLGLLPHRKSEGKIKYYVQKQKQKEAEMKQLQQAEWDQEYNKFYYSPFLDTDELNFLISVLKNSGYTALLSAQDQQQLTEYFCNAPPRSTHN